MEDDKKKSTNKTLVNIKTAKPFGIVASKAITAGSLIAMRDSILATNKSLYGEGSAFRTLQESALKTSSVYNSLLKTSIMSEDLLRTTGSIVALKESLLSTHRGLYGEGSAFWALQESVLKASRMNDKLSRTTESILALKDYNLNNALKMMGSIDTLKDYALIGSKWNTDILGITGSILAMKENTLTSMLRTGDSISRVNTIISNATLGVQMQSINKSISSISKNLLNSINNYKYKETLFDKLDTVINSSEAVLEDTDVDFLDDIVSMDTKNDIALTSNKIIITDNSIQENSSSEVSPITMTKDELESFIEIKVIETIETRGYIQGRKFEKTKRDFQKEHPYLYIIMLLAFIHYGNKMEELSFDKVKDCAIFLNNYSIESAEKFQNQEQLKLDILLEKDSI